MSIEQKEMRGSVWFDFKTPLEPINPNEEIDLKTKPTTAAQSPTDLARIYSEAGTVTNLKKRLSAEYGVPTRMTRFLMDQFNVPIMNEGVRKRGDRIRANWRDDDKRRELIGNLHSPQAKRNRTQAIKLSWQEGDRAEERKEMLRDLRKKRKGLNPQSKLGEDPKAEFNNLRDQGLNDFDIARRLGVGITIIRRWRAELDVPATGRASNLNFTERTRRSKFIKEVRGALSGLDKRSARIIAELYPISGMRPSLREVGEKVGLGHDRVRQIENEILARLGYSSTPED